MKYSEVLRELVKETKWGVVSGEGRHNVLLAQEDPVRG